MVLYVYMCVCAVVGVGVGVGVRVCGGACVWGEETHPGTHFGGNTEYHGGYRSLSSAMEHTLSS